MINKKAIAMPFNWMFAIIAGGIILFLAIYGAVQFIQTSEKTIYTETAAKLVTLLDPLETGLASEKSIKINFKKPAKTFYDCNYLDNKPFGKQTIAFSEQTLGKDYEEAGEEISIKNKYIFAEEIVEGENLYLFSKPFFMGFKVADLIMISSKDYCFYQAPNKIKSDIDGLNLDNIRLSDNLDNCTGEIVCFDLNKDECDIKVFSREGIESGRVIKNNKEVYYEDSLIYAAIFSSPEIYECNVKRLANKFNELSLVYKDKIKIIERKGCTLSINNDFDFIRSININSSKDLILISEETKKIDLINQALGGCRLY